MVACGVDHGVDGLLNVVLTMATDLTHIEFTGPPGFEQKNPVSPS